MNVTYIHHDGFLVETDRTSLLFDYESGEIPPLDPRKPLIVFASHSHHDHFVFDIFPRTAAYPGARYILANDIHRRFNRKAFLRRGATEEQYDRILFVHPDETHALGSLTVKTLRSTDLGVAFVVEETDADGQLRRIYHAGDLNDWTWPGKDEAVNKKEQEDYHRILAPLKDKTFELAFVPCDPRQEEHYWRGIDHFMRLTDTKEVWPMHYWDDVSVIDRLISDPVSEPYRDKIRGKQ